MPRALGRVAVKSSPLARTRATRAMARAPTPARALGHDVRGDRARARVVLGAWLDFACPFSGRFHRNILRALDAYARRDDVCVIEYNHPQPWHAQSTVAHETSLACAMVRADGFATFADAAFAEDNWDAFTDVATVGKTRGEMYDAYVEIAKRGGLREDEAREARALLELDADALGRGEKNPGNATTRELKFYVKLGRQTGVHVSPSAYVNGLFVDTSSAWTTEQWHAFFDDVLA